MQRSFWQRRKTRLLVSVIAVILIVVFVFGGLSLFWLPSAEGDLVNFACGSSSRNQPFIVSVEVNLADGMNQKEAEKVASKVLSGMSLEAPGGALQILSANYTRDEMGIWTAEFIVGAPMVGGSVGYSGNEVTWHSRETVIMRIDPFDKTVECSNMRVP